MNQKRCPQCGVIYDQRVEMCTECYNNLVPFESQEDPMDAAMEQCGENVWHCGHCGLDNALDATECLRCFEQKPAVSPGGKAVQAGIVIQWPWGGEKLNGELAVGRDPAFSPIAHRLARYDNISRRHAVLRLIDDVLVIEDQGSANGTFIDGQRLKTPYRMTTSGVIRFAADLTVGVEI